MIPGVSRGSVMKRGNHPPLKLVVSHNNEGALLGPEVSLFRYIVRPFPLSEGRGVFSLGLLNLLDRVRRPKLCNRRPSSLHEP